MKIARYRISYKQRKRIKDYYMHLIVVGYNFASHTFSAQGSYNITLAFLWFLVVHHETYDERQPSKIY
jgi:hypothetical protein